MLVLREGDRGPEVRRLQLLLNTQRLQGHRLDADGSFGPKTRIALREFQTKKKLEVDGVAGPSTWHALGIEEKPNKPPPVQSTSWMEIAGAELGIREDARAGHHTQRILDYHQTTTLKATTDEVAWCSSFVNWVLKEANIKGTNSAAARSWLTWGRELQDPQLGAITITKKRGADVANGSTSGFHVAFYHSAGTGTKFSLLGGNQGDAVRIREYDAKKYEFVKYRWPT
jgi:uncharacterized protein (TIGR02594 family)